ncbi:MAG: hypothetical protein KJO82_09230 [Gammaproteobacteria bacterium]|nr:hypothetical protein [Gammaproteobacteria bacterium]
MKMSTTLMPLSILFLGSIVFFSTASSQVLDKNKIVDLSGETKGLDPKKLPKTQGPSGSIAGVTNPEVVSTDKVYQQGRGEVHKIELSFFASIRNPGSTSQAFRIIAEVDGGRGFRSGPFSIPAGQTSRRPIRFQSEFEVPSGDSRLPINIILQDLKGVELDRVARIVDPGFRDDERQNAMSLARPRDLAITNIRVEMIPAQNRRPKLAELGLPSGVHPAKTKAFVTVRNTGTQRWGYHASLTVQYQQGRPDNLRPITGTGGLTKPIPGGLQPGEQATYELVIDRGLTAGYYYTATVVLNSRDDQVDDNDRQVVTFFVEPDSTVTVI